MNSPLSWVCWWHSGLGWGGLGGGEWGLWGKRCFCVCSWWPDGHLHPGSPPPSAVQWAVVPAPYWCSSRSLGTVGSELSGRGHLGLRSHLALTPQVQTVA